MTRPALRVDGLGKRYQLGLTHAGSLSAAASRWSRRLRGLPPEEGTVQVDPQAPANAAAKPAAAADNGEFWALQDVSFEVQPGEVVGVIGRNGAGKSTLLKVLSRVTAPTTGTVEVEGRVGSLLEVGTGFHPELTGRENVYMNATLLGMSKREVSGKLDEIVEFSGVEKFLDTPVKRYSSGMKVRLGFAVAAHLEPEVLIVDEVLAVGDAEFQRKCLGKMRSVAGQGRTVLFVSHNMTAVQTLCDRGVFLQGGRVCDQGPVTEIIQRYLAAGSNETVPLSDRTDRTGSGAARFEALRVLAGPERAARVAATGEPLRFATDIALRPEAQLRNVIVSLGIDDALGQRVMFLSTELVCRDLLSLGGPGSHDAGAPAADGTPETNDAIGRRTGRARCEVTVPRLPLPTGRYSVTVFLNSRDGICDWVQQAGTFEVEGGDFHGIGRPGPPGRRALEVEHEAVLFEAPDTPADPPASADAPASAAVTLAADSPGGRVARSGAGRDRFERSGPALADVPDDRRPHGGRGALPV